MRDTPPSAHTHTIAKEIEREELRAIYLVHHSTLLKKEPPESITFTPTTLTHTHTHTPTPTHTAHKHIDTGYFLLVPSSLRRLRLESQHQQPANKKHKTQEL